MFKAKCLKPYFKKYFIYYIIGVVSLTFVNIMQLKIPLIVGQTTDGLKSGILNNENLLDNIKYLLLVGIGIVIGRFIWRYYIFGTARKIEYHVRNDLVAHLAKMSLNYFNKNKTGDLMAHATNDLNAVRMAIGPGLLMIFDSVTLTTLVLIQMSTTISVSLTLMAIIPLPIIAIGGIFLGKSIRVRFKDKQEAFSKLTDHVQENISGIRVVKAFIQEVKEIQAFAKINKNNYEKNIRVVKLFAILMPLIGVVSGLSIMISLAYGGYLTMTGSISLGDFVAFIQYIMMLIWPMMAFGWCINIFSQGQASIQRLQNIFDQVPEICDKEGVKEIIDIKGSVEVKDLSFTYPDSEVEVLKEVSFSIKEGQTLGILGKTGSGKSTLINLLLRLHNPKPNQILIDGKDILDIPVKQLRSIFGYVPQDNFLFSDTIANNIAFGLDNTNIVKVRAAARQSDVHNNINEFPKKYDTIVGERGVTLSGGQKQRVSIARALIKEPIVLILDDSLSAVDTNTEDKILSHIKELRQNKTNILIAHRISTIQHADSIIVLDEGKIVEQGTHEELVKLKGIYHQMVEKQKLEEAIYEIDTK